MSERNSGGFTLIEILIVFALFAIVSILAIPNFLSFQGSARQVEAKMNLAAIYDAEIVFLSNNHSYTNMLDALGWQPKGKVYYTYGFAQGAPVPPAAPKEFMPEKWAGFGCYNTSLAKCSGKGNLYNWYPGSEVDFATAAPADCIVRLPPGWTRGEGENENGNMLNNNFVQLDPFAPNAQRTPQSEVANLNGNLLNGNALNMNVPVNTNAVNSNQPLGNPLFGGFKVCAVGKIGKSGKIDVWTIDETKNLVNVVNGSD